MQIKLDVDSETFGRLVERADIERRPVGWQAEILIRQAPGLPFPYPAIEKPNPAPRISDTAT
jgi:hypothetical protein